MKLLLVIFTALSMTLTLSAAEFDDEEYIEDDEILEDESLTMDSLMSDLDSMITLPNSDPTNDVSDTVDNDSVSSVADNGVSSYALVGSNGVYNSAWSGSVLDYFAGVVSKEPFCDYVIYRVDNNVYYCWYGDISLDNGYFSGSDLNLVCYSAGSYNTPEISFSSGRTLSLYADGFIYSNLGSFSDVTNNLGVKLAYVEIVSICILIGMFIVMSILRAC